MGEPARPVFPGGMVLTAAVDLPQLAPRTENLERKTRIKLATIAWKADDELIDVQVGQQISSFPQKSARSRVRRALDI